jgi:hypothetical protein
VGCGVCPNSDRRSVSTLRTSRVAFGELGPNPGVVPQLGSCRDEVVELKNCYGSELFEFGLGLYVYFMCI